MYRLTELGDTRPVVMTCPPCSYLWEGKCLICEPEDPHPGCQGCIDGQLPKVRWYQTDLAQAIAAGVVVSLAVSVATALMVPRVERLLKRPVS